MMTRSKRSLTVLAEPRKRRKTSPLPSSSQDEDNPSFCQPSTSQQHLSSLPSSDTKHLDENALVSLPLLVLIKIIDYVSLKDVCHLSGVNKFLHNFIESHFITNVTLIGSPPSTPAPTPEISVFPRPAMPAFYALPSSLPEEEECHSLSVLNLTITYNISQLPTDLFAYPPFAKLNLQKLKQLKITGKNHIWNKQYLLSDLYKNTIDKLLRHKTYRYSIQKLEFLTDESKRSVDIVQLCRFFPNLTEVTLHGIGYFDTGSYHMDKDVAQNIINGILWNTRIKTLRLKSFDTLHRFIVVQSETLEELHAEFGKHFEIGFFYLPIAKKITLETSMWAGCFYHAQNGELKKIVSQGCPKLETFNSIDLSKLAAMSESQHWLDQLGPYCASIQTQSDTQCTLCCSNVD